VAVIAVKGLRFEADMTGTITKIDCGKITDGWADGLKHPCQGYEGLKVVDKVTIRDGKSGKGASYKTAD